MPQPLRRHTVRDLRSFPEDGQRYELVRGELFVSPAPSPAHQLVILRLYDQLRAYLHPLGLGETVFCVAADISWDDETLVQPDILIVRPEELSARWSTIRQLRLAVEVVSPGSGRRDRWDKRRLYQEHRVETYWVVDPESALVEVWRPTDERPLIAADRLGWQVTPEAPLLHMDVPALFRNLPIAPC
ncbi:MAG: Uma2 family endonuclease [Gemmatimonadales bacterium]